ncbi:type IV pilus twitching motility protein PilT [Candidatus Omnitrophota bacterium]
MKIDELLKSAVESNASDLHITVGEPPMLRLAGKLAPMKYDKLTPEKAKTLIYSILNEQQRQKFEEELELDLSYSIPDVSRFRVNVYSQKDGVGAAIRVIPSKIPKPEEIDMPKAAIEFTRLNQGLVLVTGPTGSGKSTTLATMIDLINQERACHIMTIEDPIEFLHSHKSCMANQRELGAHTLSFPNALKHLLRQDPDVVLVGEMRDLETIAATVTIAETGHLVFATLHTLDAAQTIDRIIDVFPSYQQQQIRMMLAGCLKGVICQQLIPRKDGKGRVAAREILVVTKAVSNLVREGKAFQIYTVIQTGTSFGMCTMDQSVRNLVKKGLITQEAASASVSDLKTTIKPLGGKV